MANTFAIIVSGRLAQTDFQLVESNKCLITIPNADNINHLVVFMTGSTPLPEGMAGAVYFSFPDPSSPPTWIYLGFISNQKPSAIFKITKLKQISTSGNLPVNNGFGYMQPIVSHVAQIGISIEPLANVMQLSADPSISADANNQMGKFESFATQTAENLYNYCLSFANSLTHYATTVGQNNPNMQLIPTSAINNWYERFMRNLKQNPNFLR